MKAVFSILVFWLINSKCIPLYSQNTQQNICVNVKWGDLKPSDSMVLLFWDQPLCEKGMSFVPKKRLVAGRNSNNIFVFHLSAVRKIGYLSLLFGSGENMNSLLHGYLAERGDSILIEVCPSISKDNASAWLSPIDGDLSPMVRNRHNVLKFYGKGYEKYECRYLVDQDISFLSPTTSLKIVSGDGNIIKGNYCDYSLKTALEKLKQYKNILSSLAYNILLADFVGKWQYEKFKALSLLAVKKLTDPSIITNLKNSFNDLYSVHTSYLVSSNSAALSRFYPQYLVLLKCTEYMLLNKARYRDSCYSLFSKYYRDELRDKLLIVFFIESINGWMNYPSALIKDAISITGNNFYREKLQSLLGAYSSGVEAYNFSLPDASGKIHHLQDYRGKVVFLDFWFSGCGACLGYYKNIVSSVEEKYLNDKDIVFISISIDTNKDLWIKSVQSGKYTSPEVVNLYTDGQGSDHLVIEKFGVIGYPRPIIIDRHGKIFNAAKTELRSAALEQQIIEALKRGYVKK
jgi:thiol-disulfide isomerase/thioredoxin